MPHAGVVTLIQGLSEYVRLVFARELEDGGLDEGLLFHLFISLCHSFHKIIIVKHLSYIYRMQLSSCFCSDDVQESRIEESCDGGFSPSSSMSDLKAFDVQYVELEKGDKGLGFSILDYQVDKNF